MPAFFYEAQASVLLLWPFFYCHFPFNQGDDVLLFTPWTKQRKMQQYRVLQHLCFCLSVTIWAFQPNSIIFAHCFPPTQNALRLASGSYSVLKEAILSLCRIKTQPKSFLLHKGLIVMLLDNGSILEIFYSFLVIVRTL